MTDQQTTGQTPASIYRAGLAWIADAESGIWGRRAHEALREGDRAAEAEAVMRDERPSEIEAVALMLQQAGGMGKPQAEYVSRRILAALDRVRDARGDDEHAARTPTPSGAYTAAMDKVTGRASDDQDDAASAIAEQLRSRFHQRVLDAIVAQEIGRLTTEPQLSSVEVPTITVEQIIGAMNARAARADA